MSLQNHRSRSLVLAAHGSLAEPDSNKPLFDLAAKIAERGKFETVTPAFLNGQPLMSNVLEQLPVGDVVVVPVMTSEGYYLRKLPSKFDENANRSDFRLLMSRVVGVHETIPAIVAQRIIDLVQQHELPSDATTVVLVGHGTKRNRNSGDATFRLAEEVGSRVLAHSEFASLKIEVGFLDQDPPIDEIASSIKTANILVVPFLISFGPHMTEDVPNAFDLESGPQIQLPLVKANHLGGKTVCDLPVGMYPEIADVCLELAHTSIVENTPVPLAIGDPS